jgi:hypothetical protein
MVVRVASGQVRFVLPQLTVDARGVAFGRDLALRFATMERLVAFFRLASSDMGIDELGAQLRIHFTRAAQGTREVLLTIEHAALHVVDAVLGATRAAQGTAFSGTGRHFVTVRDRNAPLGYDVESLSSEACDIVLYGHDSRPQALSFEGELSVLQLFLRLELLRVKRGPEGLSAQKVPSTLYVTVRRGLGPALLQSLHHAGVHAFATVIEEPTVDIGGSAARSTWLVRIENAPKRLWGTLLHTPGLVAYFQANENVLVPIGFRHPVHLEACKSIFPDDQMVLFATAPSSVRVIRPLPQLLPIEDLVRLPSMGTFSAANLAPVRPSSSGLAVDLRTQLTVIRVPPRGEVPVATLVPWAHVRWIKRIGAGLPLSILANYKVAALTRGLLVYGHEGLQWMPFGNLLRAAAKGVLVPVGHALRPAVSAALLEEQLGTADGSLVVFPSVDEAPFRVAFSDLVALERHVLGELAVTPDPSTHTLETIEPGPSPDIRYKSGIAMPLWGEK